jgi:hypothetical protein
LIAGHAWLARIGVLASLLVGSIAAATALAPPANADGQDPNDEIVFYMDDGLYRYYDIKPDGTLRTPVNGGNGYTSGWDSIVGVDVDGGGQDEIFFYREDGLYVYYDIRADGSLGAPIFGDDGYTKGWSSIVAVDLDADGQDEMFFYREDGLFAFYDVKPNGRLGSKISSGTGYTKDWSSIVAVDLDGGGQDEMFFYRDDGLYAYYEVRASGTLGGKISSGTGYTKDWSSILALDLDGDRQDEMFFYREDGLYRYYDVRANGSLGSLIQGGTDYSAGWSVISALQLHGDLPVERISRFTTYFDCCQNRVTNIRQIAREIDGTVVMPGETFSIDAITGPRTTSGGYLPAPYLQNGEGQCCAVGGGVSQFGTTIHNAVFWAGLEVVDHRPHTGWISRYPLGIEATLVYRSIDYKFTNDTATPVTIRTSSTSTSVTVEIWGNQGGWQVTGYHPRGARNSRLSVLDNGGSDAKRVRGVVYGSAPGTVRIVRTLTQNGVSRSQTWWWRYVS